MRSCASPALAEPDLAARYERLRGTATLRGEAHARWCASRLALVGCGNLGARFALEAVRSGASVWMCDPDVAEDVNLGTQPLERGVPKAESARRACDAILPGRARAEVCDVLRAGIAPLAGADLIVDCSDDPRLGWPLTEISNGLGVPLLRLALDGSGERELGRALVSHGGAGFACQACTWTAADLARSLERTPCRADALPERAPTRAGGALGMVVAGFGLLQAQRLLVGNGAEIALEREVVLDLDGPSCIALELRRSEACLSGHRRWRLVRVGRRAAQLSLGELFDLAGRELEVDGAVLEPFAHPLCVEAVCACGARRSALGSDRSCAPDCPACGKRMGWNRAARLPRLDSLLAARLGAMEMPVGSLGLPSEGAVVAARVPGGRAVHLWLDE